jgi:hypothetical protein
LRGEISRIDPTTRRARPSGPRAMQARSSTLPHDPSGRRHRYWCSQTPAPPWMAARAAASVTARSSGWTRSAQRRRASPGVHAVAPGPKKAGLSPSQDTAPVNRSQSQTRSRVARMARCSRSRICCSSVRREVEVTWGTWTASGPTARAHSTIDGRHCSPCM